MDWVNLDQSLLDAHERNDLAELVRLYILAGDETERHGDIDAACFFLTQAFVFALELGAPEAPALNKRLADKGRAHRLQF